MPFSENYLNMSGHKWYVFFGWNAWLAATIGVVYIL